MTKLLMIIIFAASVATIVCLIYRAYHMPGFVPDQIIIGSQYDCKYVSTSTVCTLIK